MNDLYDILNIKKNNIEKIIQEVITSTKRELANLDTDRTCFIYTSYLYEKLKNRNILAYIVDTMEDLGENYQHRFIVIPKDSQNNYVLDLTISQFGKNEKFKKMELDGYQILDNDNFSSYIGFVSNDSSKKK